jgi:hypothetical protein
MLTYCANDHADKSRMKLSLTVNDTPITSKSNHEDIKDINQYNKYKFHSAKLIYGNAEMQGGQKIFTSIWW